MNECEYTGRIAAYRDGEVPPGERRAIEEHLTQCEACARELAQLERLGRMLGDACAGPEAGVLARVSAEVLAARERVIVRLANVLTAAAALVFVACTTWVSVAADGDEVSVTPASAWEVAAVTGTDETSASTRQPIARWIITDLSLENADD